MAVVTAAKRREGSGVALHDKYNVACGSFTLGCACHVSGDRKASPSRKDRWPLIMPDFNIW